MAVRMEHVDGEALRTVMRRLPSPVTVVTAAAPTEQRGITIGSFTSVSLDPPLISFNVARIAQMYGLITEAAHFAVHILHEDQAHLSNHFALPDLPGDAQFEGVPHRVGAHGTPILDDVLAVLHCRRYAVYDAGDHVIVLGEVLQIEDDGSGRPVLYFDRSYRKVGEAVVPRPSASMKRSSSGTP